MDLNKLVEEKVNHFKEKFNIKEEIEVTELTDGFKLTYDDFYSYFVPKTDIINGIAYFFEKVIGIIVRREYYFGV